MIRNIFYFIAVLLVCSETGLAQFGGREGDVVIYALTSKGRMDFQVVPSTTTNDGATAAKFEFVDPLSRVATPVSPGFGARQRRILHNEPDDLFQFGTQVEKVRSPHYVVQATAKLFLLKGILRDDNVGSFFRQPLDFLAGAYAPFIKDVVGGPDVALDTVDFLFWTNKPGVTTFREVPFGYPQSPDVPPLYTGPEYEATFAKAPFFIQWDTMRRIYPGVGWPDGVDLKLVEPQDPVLGNTTQLIRIRPGKRTPLFTIAGNTHLFVVEGNVEITPANSSTVSVKTNQYAFIPKGFAIRLSNPKRFTGLGALK